MSSFPILKPKIFPVKNFFLAFTLFFGVSTSAVSPCWGLADMYQLDKAFKVHDEHAELRHRINVFADGTWILLGVLISVVSVSGIHKPRRSPVRQIRLVSKTQPPDQQMIHRRLDRR